MKFEISSGLSAALLLLAGCCGMAARDWEVKTFELPYIFDYGVTNTTTFRWRDAYLSADAYTYSQAVAGPLSALAACVYGYEQGMDEHTLTELGFNAAGLYRRYGKDLDYKDPVWGRDQVGFTLATKRVWLDGRLRDVLLILVRGTFGRTEWLSNMNMCNTWGRNPSADASTLPDLHEGFARAADAVQSAVEAYVAAHVVDLATAKVLVTGHSRGAAVANILGARLDDGAFLKGVVPQNAFIYTFATPNSIIGPHVDCTAPRYGNIFNILNPEDLVPLVPLGVWQARRYGTDLMLKNFDALSLYGVCFDPAYNAMKDNFKAMTGYDWWHTPLGTNSTSIVPAVLGAVAPTVADLYRVPEDQLAGGNDTSIHKVLEMLIYRCMDDEAKMPDENGRTASLGADVQNLTKAYSAAHDGSRPAEPEQDGYFFTPDGHDFTRQPGFFDIPWRLACMHATQTYIGWMKAADEQGPAAVYKNWRPARSWLELLLP